MTEAIFNAQAKSRKEGFFGDMAYARRLNAMLMGEEAVIHCDFRFSPDEHQEEIEVYSTKISTGTAVFVGITPEWVQQTIHHPEKEERLKFLFGKLRIAVDEVDGLRKDGQNVVTREDLIQAGII